MFVLFLFLLISVETLSELIYTPKSERDYGTLSCWGKNSIGKQLEACLFQIVPAGIYFIFLKFDNDSNLNAYKILFHLQLNQQLHATVLFDRTSFHQPH